MTAVPSRARLVVALALGCAVGVGFFRLPPAAGYEAADLTPIWRAARTLLEGGDPYAEALRHHARFVYPLPAVIVVAPLAALPVRVAGAVWAGLGMALLVWVALGRFGLHGVAVACSWSASRATALAQWSPLFLLGAVVPPVQLLAVAKPTLGLIMFAYRPTRWAVVGGAVLLALSFALHPTWLGDWLAQTRGVSYYVPAAAVWRGGGPLLLLATLRWRRPEARLLVAMALVPHNFVWYDQLLLFLVPRTAREVWTLSALSWASVVVGSILIVRLGIPEPAGQVAFRAPVVALMYLPCLLMVLRRPNVTADD